MRSILALLIAASAASSALAQDRSPDLAAALHLRPDQRIAYAAYLRATAPDPAVENRRRVEAARFGRMTTPARIDWTRAQLAQDLADLDRQGAAAKRFYAALTPEQRRTFDDATAPPRER